MIGLEGNDVIRFAKRLRAAMGYYELGMTQHAVECLDSAAAMKDIGPLRLAISMIKAHFAMQPHRFEAASTLLEAIARAAPRPQSQSIWLVLSLCYNDAGDSERAIDTLACARGAKPPATSVQPE